MTKDVRVIRPTAEGLDAHKTRVAAYCRVSTDSADQVNSFIAQVKYYNDYIRVSKDLVLVDVYADEGITGTCTAKREEFNRMIRDSKLGKIDRIFVKSVSRFARNSLECIENIRLLKSYGTTVLFENDGIDTSSMNSEMILYIKSAFAQSEALSGSKRVSTAIRMKMETGTFCTYHAPFGYKLENGTLIPIDEEIKIVKRIFDDYLHGKGHNKIAMELNDENAIGKPWGKERVRYILSNEKYIGDSLFQKTYTPRVFPLRNIRNNGEVDQYYVSNTHQGIVDRQTFNKVKIMLERNIEENRKKQKREKHSFAGKIICGDCGWRYKKKSSGESWVCTKSGTAGHKCESYPITESAIEKTFVVLYNKLQQNIDILVNEPLNMLLDVKRIILSGSDVISEIDSEIAELAEQNGMYVQFHAQNIIDDVTYLEQTNDIKKRLNTLRSRRLKLLNEDEEEQCIEKIRQLKSFLMESPKGILWYDDRILTEIIEKVLVVSKEEIEFELKCGFRFKERIVWN